MTFAEILAVYMGSDGDATKALYDRLRGFGTAGDVATNLFRAHKTSSRAKKYRGGGYRGMAYDKKNWSIANLTKALTADGAGLGIIWGWGIDPAAVGFENVLYVEIPTGQVSFHSSTRGDGPTYTKGWDQARDVGPTRICRWIETILNGDSNVVT